MLTPCWAILFEYVRRDGLLNTLTRKRMKRTLSPILHVCDKNMTEWKFHRIIAWTLPPPSFGRNVHTHNNYKPKAKGLPFSSFTSQWTILGKNI